MSEIPTAPCPGCGAPAQESNSMVFCGVCRRWYGVKPEEKKSDRLPEAE